MGELRDIDYSKYPESDVIVDYIVKRYRKGLYTLTLVWGLPGTGKSSTCIRLAELTSMQLNNGINKLKKTDVVDDLKDLLKRIIDSQPGDIIVIEEVSVLFPSRRSMANDNVAIGRILDTCRKKRIILFSNAPIYGSIDKHIRCMAHIGLETLKVVRQKKVVVHKPLILQTNPGSGETYRHRFRRNGCEIHRTYTKMPDAKMWGEYEKQKDKFIFDTYKILLAQAQKKHEKLKKDLGIDSDAPRVQVRPLTKKEMEIHELVNIQKLSQTQAARKLGVSVVCVHERLNNLNKKMRIVKETENVNTNETRANDIELLGPEINQSKPL